MKIIPLAEARGQVDNASYHHPGHEARLVGHKRRIRSHRCDCDSGKAHGDCCMGRMDQEQRELDARDRKEDIDAQL